MIETKFSDQILLHKKYVDSFLNIFNVCFYHMKVHKDPVDKTICKYDFQQNIKRMYWMY